eukprot:5087866-Amphidinium_carterae.1
MAVLLPPAPRTLPERQLKNPLSLPTARKQTPLKGKTWIWTTSARTLMLRKTPEREPGLPPPASHFFPHKATKHRMPGWP